MSSVAHELQGLLQEHRALMREYGQAQTRCSRVAAEQAGEIEWLQAEVLRLRAAVVVRDTALAWMPEQRQDSVQAAADLVICQTGCLSHGAYWRAQDHCRRTGRICVLVLQTDAVAARVAVPADDSGTAVAAPAASGREHAREQRGHVDATCIDCADHAA